MNALAGEHYSSTTEWPLVAVVRVALMPTLCVLALAACVLAYGEPLAPHYQLLMVTAFLVSMQVFGEFPLAGGLADAAPLRPASTIVTGWLIVVSVLLLLGFATKLSALYSRKVVLSWLVLAPFVLCAGQGFARRLLTRYLSASGAPRTRIIVGASDVGRELARRIAADPSLRAVRGFFDDRSRARLPGLRSGQLLGRLEDLVDYVKRHAVDVVYIALPVSRDRRIGELLRGLRDTTASLYLVPNALPEHLIQTHVELIGGIPTIAVCETPFRGLNAALKRATDLALAALILLLIWPLMLAIAVGVKLSSPGPVLFRQRRYGLDGRQIAVCKFRSMTVCEDGDEVRQATRSDARVTRFGAILRRTSLDELPQLFNVLQGTMSIVGPRPHAVAHNEQYRGLIDGYMLRHKVRPGITGWAQINGYRGETADVEMMKKRVEYDLDYLKHWSLALDLWIILRTALVVVHDHRAY